MRVVKKHSKLLVYAKTTSRGGNTRTCRLRNGVFDCLRMSEKNMNKCCLSTIPTGNIMSVFLVTEMYPGEIHQGDVV